MVFFQKNPSSVCYLLYFCIFRDSLIMETRILENLQLSLLFIIILSQFFTFYLNYGVNSIIFIFEYFLVLFTFILFLYYQGFISLLILRNFYHYYFGDRIIK